MDEVIDKLLELKESIVYIECPKCARRAAQDPVDSHMCVDCAKAENVRYTYIHQHQNDWLLVAKEAGIDVWLRQPSETQWEYTVWVAYRDSYPGKKPSYTSVAKQLTTTYNAVRKIAQRWSFQARMQAWMTECDRITMLQRSSEILSMNAEHISMAKRLRDKLSTAIDVIDPKFIKPSELASLIRVGAELERKARVDSIAQDNCRSMLASDNNNPELRKGQTKQSDLQDIITILMNAGALSHITTIGIRETRTTEMALMGRDGVITQVEQMDE